MTTNAVTPLSGEHLISLDEAAQDFGGVAIPLATVRKYVYRGLRGVKLESVNINRRFTSREAIQRFIERKQGDCQKRKPLKVRQMTQAEVDAGLKKYGLIK